MASATEFEVNNGLRFSYVIHEDGSCDIQVYDSMLGYGVYDAIELHLTAEQTLVFIQDIRAAWSLD